MINVFIDFEFTESNNFNPRLFCCSLKVGESIESFWLLNDDYCNTDRATDKLKLLERLRQLKGATIIGYAIIAEIRCFLALELQPEDYNWIDLHAEFRQLVNGCDRWAYGFQWTNQRKTNTWIKRFCYPSMPKEKVTTYDDDEFEVDHSTPRCNLINAKLKFLNIDSDPRKKDTMRELILENRKHYTSEEQQAIMRYCESDVKYLPALYHVMTEELEELLARPENPRNILRFQLERGRSCIATARMEQVGMPIDLPKLNNLSNNYEPAVNHVREKCNNVYPFFTKKKEQFVETREAFHNFLVSKNLLNDWPLTDKGYPCKKDEVLKFYQEQCPEIKALREAKNLLKQLKWYRPEAKKEFDKEIGSDGRLRCYFNPYGTATSRNAPPATIFIPAQSKWLRALIRPPEGLTIVGADYKSQEFFVTGALSNDENMLATYFTGDVYLDFALQLGMIDCKKDFTEDVKKLCKAFILGVGYGMGAETASRRLNISLRQAQELIYQHKRRYKDYWEFREACGKLLRSGKPLVLKSGWALFPDANYMTGLNFPIQGTAQDILRRAVFLLHEVGVQIFMTLHDAIYILCKDADTDLSKSILVEKMLQASKDVLGLEGMQVDVSSHNHQQTWIEKGFEEYGKFLEVI